MRRARRTLANDGDTWRMVDRVELAAFGGQTATYSFNYGQRVLEESAFDTSPATMPTRSAHLLTSITLPDGSRWEMDYYTQRSEGSGADLSAAENQPGALKRLELPTLGAYEWTYQDYTFPSRAQPGAPGAGTLRLVRSAGARRKRVLGFNGCENHGSVGCEWHYETVQIGGPGVRTTVTYPSGDESAFYFDTTPRPDPNTFEGWEYGMPFTRTVSDGQGRYLSQRIYDGPAGGGTLLREVYVGYERDQLTTNVLTSELPHYWENSNRREASRKTVFKDDSNHFKLLSRSDFDGLGHYRRTDRSGSLPGGSTRVEQTDYNTGRGSYTVDLAANTVSGGFQPWPTTSPWVLGTFAEMKTTEGADTEIQRFCFDAATGFLERRRTLEGSTLGADDLIVDWDRNLNGNVSAEAFHGGDNDAVTTSASWCGATLGTPPYRRTFTYQSGARRTSRWDGAPHLDLDLTLDAATGLPSRSRDVSGLETTFTYDSSGRITSETPQSGHGARTVYQWTRAFSAGSPAKVDVQVKNNAGTVTLARSEQQWDALGRPSRQRILGADGVWSSVVTAHDSMGRRFSVSEREAGFPQHHTFFRDYDPFGRPGRIEPPDDPGHRLLFFYTGDRVAQREVLVCGQAGGCTTSAQEIKHQLQERFDQHGRLYEVVEPSGAGGANVTTRYGYDAGNRLSLVTTLGGGQNRSFDYDHRGFLLSECHPEKGATGNGCVTYESYDALGNLGRKIDSPFEVLHAYDAAGRMTQLDERYFNPAIQDFDTRPLKIFTYAPTNAGADRRLGKLKQAQRFNYVTLNGTPFTVEVRETYTYAGKGGAVSSRDTEFFVNGGAAESFSQGFTWSDLGDPETVDYPRCTHAACTNALPKLQTFGYQNGFLTSLPGYATALTYHPNGMGHQIFRSNGVTDTQEADLSGMRRPRFISTTGASGGDWSTGTYRYDGAGNVHRIGGSTFAYDGVSRLVAATVDLGDGGNCPGDLTLSNQTLSGLQTHESCASLFAGPNLTVAAGADVTVRAADRVIIRDGFAVYDGARFEAATDPSLFGSGTGSGATTSRNYTYDRYGNLVNIAGDGGRAIPVSASTNRLTGAVHDAAGNVTSYNGRTFEYDAAGMMWGQSRPNASDPDGQEEWLYFYTADDEKVWSYHGSGSDWTIRDLGGQVLRHYRHVGTSWTVERNYVYAGGKLLAGTKPGVDTYHYHLDHLGSPRLITDASGMRQAYHVYYPYGEEATAAGQDSERMKFTGHEREIAASGVGDDLDYMHARWCSPVTGRFMAVDGATPRKALRSPQKWNRYGYARANPLKYLDPNGLAELNFTVRTFISAPSVGIGAMRFKGDNRGFTSADASYRTSQTFTVETNPRIASNPLLSDTKRVGLTERIDRSGNVVAERLASDAGLSVAGSRTPAGDVIINIKTHAKNPFAPFGMGPAIDNSLQLVISQDGDTIIAQGTLDGFPATEIYVANEAGETIAIVQFDPGDVGNDEFSLFPGIGEQRVRTTCTDVTSSYLPSCR